MAVPVTVPRLGEEMRSAILIQFLVPAGSTVTRGQPLYELDTDKVTQEVEAEADGVVLRVDASEGGGHEGGGGGAGGGRCWPGSARRVRSLHRPPERAPVRRGGGGAAAGGARRHGA